MRSEKRSRSGQVMLEYLLSLIVFLAVIFLGMLLYDAFQSYGNRALDLIGSEYP